MINMNTSMWRNIISRARFAPCKAFEELTKMTQNCEKKQFDIIENKKTDIY